MKTKLIKFIIHETCTFYSHRLKKDVKHYLGTTVIEYLLITKEADTSRLCDYKQALGTERFHNLIRVVKGCNSSTSCKNTNIKGEMKNVRNYKQL